MSNVCMMCLGTLHGSCLTESCACNQQYHNIEELSSHGKSDPSINEDENDSLEVDARENGGSRFPSSRNSEVRENGRFSSSAIRRRGRESSYKDQQSTGRKQAAKLYRLDRERDCEWSNRDNCGGGKHPIRGCISGKQQARHHGPDKTVSNNEAGNVHRICHYCHNRWHQANDASYDWNNPCVTPHSPESMSPAVLQAAVIDEMRYLGTKTLVEVND